ncbi:hypothetical protein BMETH_1179_2 [methanotrophic bacterial endosymbiont of Bathymodiolus sp.]|nr:hypothetical protein BMETH_1179_2 [methanotrophic bacterial endosymbiont of Bathymodiolus sp.]
MRIREGEPKANRVGVIPSTSRGCNYSINTSSYSYRPRSTGL